MKGCPRVSYPSFLSMQYTSLIPRTKGLQWTGPFCSPNTYTGCSDAQPKHHPVNFVKQSITALSDSLEKSQGWSRLLPAMHHWSEHGLQMLRRPHQGKTNISSCHMHTEFVSNQNNKKIVNLSSLFWICFKHSIKQQEEYFLFFPVLLWEYTKFIFLTQQALQTPQQYLSRWGNGDPLSGEGQAQLLNL